MQRIKPKTYETAQTVLTNYASTKGLTVTQVFFEGVNPNKLYFAVSENAQNIAFLFCEKMSCSRFNIFSYDSNGDMLTFESKIF